MLLRRYLLLALIPVLFVGSRSLQADILRGKPAEEAPTADQFFLKVESLVDNAADLDIRRFTIIALAGKSLKFHHGMAGIESKGLRADTDPANARRLEAILLLRLHENGDPKSTKIRRTMKFQRATGAWNETLLDAPGVESLSRVVDIKVKSGRYPVGRRLVVGTVHGEDLVVSVE